MSTLYRKIDGTGWLEDTARDRRNERKWLDLGWRRATWYERLWRALFWPELSWVHYGALAMVVLFVHEHRDQLDTLEWLIWIFVGTIVAQILVGIVKFATEPPRPRNLILGVWDGLREVLHNHGRHRLCRDIEVRVYDHTETGPETIVGINDNGKLEKVDVTTFGGRRVYRTEKRHG